MVKCLCPRMGEEDRDCTASMYTWESEKGEDGISQYLPWIRYPKNEKLLGFLQIAHSLKRGKITFSKFPATITNTQIKTINTGSRSRWCRKVCGAFKRTFYNKRTAFHYIICCFRKPGKSYAAESIACAVRDWSIPPGCTTKRPGKAVYRNHPGAISINNIIHIPYWYLTSWIRSFFPVYMQSGWRPEELLLFG